MKTVGSIKQKLLVIILLTNLVVSAIVYFSSIYFLLQNQHESRLELAHTITQGISQNLAKLIYTSEISTASEITAQLKSFQKIDSMILYTQNGENLFQYTKKNNLQEKHSNLKIMQPANYMGLALGSIEFHFEIESLLCILKKDIESIALFLLFLMLLSYTMAVYFASKFTAPILKLVDFLSAIDLQELNKKTIQTDEKNEFLILYEEINEILQKIDASNRLQKIASVAFEIENGMIILDENYKILQVNRAYTKITGYSFQEVKNKKPPLFQYMSSSQYEKMFSMLKSQNHYSKELQNRLKDGTVIDERVSIFNVLDHNGNMIYAVITFVDITEQKELENRLQYLQHYDTLTGLINTKHFIDMFHKKLSTSSSRDFHYLLAFNLKDFKHINTIYGRESGDLLLQQIVQKIQTHIEEKIIFSRTDADEFIIFFQNTYSNAEETKSQAKLMAEVLISLFREAFLVHEHKIYTTPYIGLTLYSEEEEDASKILKQLEVALSTAKEENLSIAFFSSDTHKPKEIEIDLYSELLNALKNDEFELYYQLQYTEKKEPYAAEALIRWNHPQRGLISPALFIPIAEKTGLISEIGRWVLKESAKQLNIWQNYALTKSWKLSINIGANHFKEEDFIEQVKTIYQKSGASFENLKIELTEYIMLKNIEDVSAKMAELKALGIMLSLDDFGTGYSSLQYLQSLPIDQVKIDQTFVMNMFENSSNIHIIEAIAMLCNALHLEIIAEGVEDEKSYEKLKSLGCNHYQGYYFAKPQKWSYIKENFSLN